MKKFTWELPEMTYAYDSKGYSDWEVDCTETRTTIYITDNNDGTYNYYTSGSSEGSNSSFDEIQDIIYSYASYPEP